MELPIVTSTPREGERQYHGKVLVLGDDTRSFLAIVRSLGRRGIIVHAAPANFRSLALRSRYIAAIHNVPPWIGDGTEWLNALAGLLQTERYDLVIPCNETTLLPLHRHRTELCRLAELALPDERSIGVLFDKHETRRLALQSDVPIPRGRLAGYGDTAEKLLSEFGAPVVIKPRYSYSLDALSMRGSVKIVRERSSLNRLLSESDRSNIIIEEFFCGEGVGVSVLASRGRLLQAFEHHRVREIAGASFYRRSAPLTPALVQACEAITAALEYTGVAMFEFKQNPAGAWVLLEVNARPWGSMPLPVALGVDFPHRWYRLLIAGEETSAVGYRTGVYGRNLLPDLSMSLVEANNRQLSPVAKAWFMTHRTAELLRVLLGNERHDVLVRDDPLPGLLELLELARAFCRWLINKIPGALTRRQRRARALLAGFRNADDVPRILFVCQGNICRSPFAEFLLRAHLGELKILIGSAGMMPQTGRAVPTLALETARARGVDLSTHRSTWLTRQMAEAASILIVFDHVNKKAVLDRYPNLKVPILLIGDLIGKGKVDDPVDGNAAVFKRIYEEIEEAVTELALLIRR